MTSSSTNHCILSLSSSQCNSLDLDGNTLGKFLDSHARASRFVRTKVFFIDGVLHNHIIIICQQKQKKEKGKKKKKRTKEKSLTISPKFAISVINTVTLVTLANSLPAASRIFTSPSIHAVVCSAILPVTSVPSARAGIWPETKMSPAAWMAWDCCRWLEGGRGERGGEGREGERGWVTHVSCDGYKFFGGIFVSVNFFYVNQIFYRAWNVSIGMNALCPPST